MSKQLSCYAKKLYHSWKKEGKSWNWLDIYVLRFETLVHTKYGTFEQVLSVGVKFWNLKRLRCTNYDACIKFWQFPNFAPYKYKQAWIILNFYTDTKNSTSPKGLLISTHDFHFHKNDFRSPIQVTCLYQQVDIISSQISD